MGHASFACPEFVALARAAQVAIVWSDVAGRVPVADRTAPFAYMRLQNMRADCATGYTPVDLDQLAGLSRQWAAGQAPRGLPYAGNPGDSVGQAGDVFAMMINGAKVRAPAAAIALAERLEKQE